MGTTYLHAVASLDGYIADERDDVGQTRGRKGASVGGRSAARTVDKVALSEFTV